MSADWTLYHEDKHIEIQGVVETMDAYPYEDGEINIKIENRNGPGSPQDIFAQQLLHILQELAESLGTQ